MRVVHSMSIELDHIFVFVDRRELGTITQKLAQIGLVETYRRRHWGQGTANICYCFSNAFLELLWVEDEVELGAPELARTKFAQRGFWFDQIGAGINPFGVAWRGDAGVIDGQEIGTWDFRPAYLPAGVSIPVAFSSDDLANPFLFTFPGTNAPDSWPKEKRGDLQKVGGFDVLAVENVSANEIGAMDLQHLQLTATSDPMPRATLLLSGKERSVTLRLPEFEWCDNALA